MLLLLPARDLCFTGKLVSWRHDGTEEGQAHLPEGYSPKCLEEVSVLKNSFALSSAPGSRAKNAVLVVFSLVLGLFWTADRADNDFFNSLVRFRYSNLGCASAFSVHRAQAA
jgi:hypothetical protein